MAYRVLCPTTIHRLIIQITNRPYHVPVRNSNDAEPASVSYKVAVIMCYKAVTHTWVLDVRSNSMKSRPQVWCVTVMMWRRECWSLRDVSVTSTRWETHKHADIPITSSMLVNSFIIRFLAIRCAIWPTFNHSATGAGMFWKVAGLLLQLGSKVSEDAQLLLLNIALSYHHRRRRRRHHHHHHHHHHVVGGLA